MRKKGRRGRRRVLLRADNVVWGKFPLLARTNPCQTCAHRKEMTDCAAPDRRRIPDT